MKKVLIVGSAEQSAGGVSTVIKLMKRMPLWDSYGCYWLGTQIQASYAVKLWYAVRAWCIAILKVWGYDIVHFHTVPDKNNLIIQLPIFLLALLGKKKIIMHIHMGNQLVNHTENRLFLWCLKRADNVVLLAKKWKTLFDERYKCLPGLEKMTTTVVYNACGADVSVPMEEKEKSIIMAAYFNDNKAPDVLLRAVKSLVLKGNMKNWHVTMMGNGEVERFRRMSEEMGLAEFVTFTGYLTGEEKENTWRRASIYCMCSYEEGFPMVVMEAWTYGVCVVSTPVGGLPDVMVEGKNMLTFDFGDDAMLAQQLMMLMNDSEKRQEMASFSRDFVRQHFSLEKINRDIIRIYEG